MPSEPEVHVVDDNVAMRGSLSFLLETSGLTNRCYASGREFLARAAQLTSGCIITDIRMPEMNGLQLIAELKTKGCLLPVIVITGHGDVPMAVEAMKMGIVDFIEKPFHDDVLIAAVRWALSLGAGLRGSAEAGGLSRLLAGLSPREVEVLHRVVEGKANKMIAYELGISPRTVEAYRANVMVKTGAHGLPDLVRMATLDGLGALAAAPHEQLPRAG